MAEEDKKNIKKSPKLKLLKDDVRIKKLIVFLDFAVGKNYKEILILGRNNFDIEIFEALPYAMPDLFVKNKSNYDTNVLEYKGLNLTCITIHKSKGLEADAVVLWNLREGVRGLPDTKGDEEELKQVLTQPDAMAFAEDRRLFYVALTRTKNEVFIIALNGHLSSFVYELVMEQDQHIATNKPICQKCGAEMIFFKDYDFYGCSNYRLTGCDYRIQKAKDFLYNQELPVPIYKPKENLSGLSYRSLSAKYLLYIKDIKDILKKHNVIDNNENITAEYNQKTKPTKEDVDSDFICGFPEQNMYDEWLSKGLIAQKNKEKYIQEKEKINELKKKVYINKYFEITHPDIEGVWKIKILPVHYVVRNKESYNRFDVPEKERVRVCEANIEENTIAEDTPLAQAILHKFEGEEYSYCIENETIKGKIIKVY